MRVLELQWKRLRWRILSVIPSVLMTFLFAFIPCAASADEMSDFRRAKAAVSSGDLLEAQGLLEDFIDDYPFGRNTLKAKYLLGHLMYRRADYSAAAAVFAGIVEDHPAWEYADRAAYGMAVAQCGTLDYAGAVRTLEMLLDTYPESEILDDSLYWLGEAYYRRGDYARALERFNEFLDDYPGHPLKENALNSAAWCLEELGKYSEAITSREQFLREFPDSTLRGRAEFHLATDYLKVGAPQAAIEHYLLSEAAAPSSPLSNQALLRAGVLLSESGKKAESIQVLEKLLAKTPAEKTSRPARLALGYCYLTTGEYGKAETVFRAHLKASGGLSQDCAASFQLALAQTAQGNFSDAAGNLTKIVREPSCDALGDASALVLAACYLKLDQPAAAANALRSHLITRDVSRRSPELLFTYAGSLVLANRFSEALPILTELSLDAFTVQEFPQIVYYDGLCSLRESRYVRASEKFAQFLSRDKPDVLAPLATYLRAYSLLKTKSLAEASVSYQDFISKWP
ncbi:MAG: outer membrane protein assembly factor BamD, partial [Candidatus Abyssobacteria bacterium SURF_17]